MWTVSRVQDFPKQEEPAAAHRISALWPFAGAPTLFWLKCMKHRLITYSTSSGKSSWLGIAIQPAVRSVRVSCIAIIILYVRELDIEVCINICTIYYNIILEIYLDKYTGKLPTTMRHHCTRTIPEVSAWSMDIISCCRKAWDPQERMT